MNIEIQSERQFYIHHMDFYGGFSLLSLVLLINSSN